jgi:hypothetical protein
MSWHALETAAALRAINQIIQDLPGKSNGSPICEGHTRTAISLDSLWANAAPVLNRAIAKTIKTRLMLRFLLRKVAVYLCMSLP